MNKAQKTLAVVGTIALLALVLAAGGWFVNTAWAQGPWNGPGVFGATCHDPTAVVNLLKLNQSELLQARQGGKSWLDIAAAQGVSEPQLVDALLAPISSMHGWMGQYYPQSNAAQMTEWMRTQIAQDIRQSQFGTMTDLRVFSGPMMGALNNTPRGMMGWGNWGGGMMNGNWGWGMMGGGMMGGWNYSPNVVATPVPSTQNVDRTLNLTASNFRFEPPQLNVKAGETVKFVIANRDNFAHNVVSQDGKLAYTFLPANQTQTVLWTAPNQPGTYLFICTWHPGMQFQVVVE